MIWKSIEWKKIFLDPKIVPASPMPAQPEGRCFKCAQLQETKEKTFKLVRNCEYEKWGFELEEVCDGRIICKVIFDLNFLRKIFSVYDLTDTSEDSKLVHRRICAKVSTRISTASERRI